MIKYRVVSPLGTQFKCRESEIEAMKSVLQCFKHLDNENIEHDEVKILFQKFYEKGWRVQKLTID